MNKKVLSAILFSALFACTGTFTSCIDNDEPEGIENLRGAKAELLRAKVAVEQANATLILAKAEVKKAEAAKTLAEARIKEAVAAKKEAEAEAEAARTEEEKARIEAQIAKYQQQIEEDALEHQQTMVGLQKFLAETQRAYEVALAQIEIAKATCTDADKVTLAQLEFAVFFYKGQVETLAGEVAGLEETYYNLTVGYKYSEELMVEAAEKAVADAEQDLKDAQDDLAYWSSYKVGDETVDGWMEKVAELNDSITLLQDLESKKLVELDVLKESEEYALLLKAEREAQDGYYNQTIDSVYSFEYLAQTKYTETLMGNFTQRGYVDPATAKAGDAADAITFLKDIYNDNAGYIADLQKEIDSYTTEKQYWLDSIAAKAGETAEDAAETAAGLIDAWTKAKDAYEAGVTLSTESITKASTGAYAVYTAAMADATKTEAQKLVAKQNFADAIVAFYNSLPAAQVTLNTITLYTGTNAAGDDVYASKTVKDWLTGNEKLIYFDSLKEYFGGNIEKLWAQGEAETLKDGKINVTGAVKSTGAIATWIEKEVSSGAQWVYETQSDGSVKPKALSLLGTLQLASDKAFGPAVNYSDRYNGDNSYLHKEPSLTDIKYVFYNVSSNVGEYGVYMLSKDIETEFVAKNYKAIIENLKAAKAYWESKWDILVAARSAAYTAMITAQTAVDDYAAQWNDRQEELDELNNRIARLTKMSDILAAAIKAYLPDEYTETYYDVEAFADFLQDMIDQAETDIYNAKVDLAAAQANKELALDGKYDALSQAKENLDKKLAELTEAQAKLDEATANLKKGLEIIAAMNAAE